MLVLTTAFAVTGLTQIHATVLRPITLTSRVLSFVDGMSHALDGHTMLSMKLIAKKIREIQSGALNPQTKKRAGTLDFQDKKITLHILVRIEERIDNKYRTAREQLEHEHIDMTRFHKEWQKRETDLIQEYEEQLLRIEEEMMVRHADDENRYVAIKQEQRFIMRKHNSLVDKEIEKIKQKHINDFELFIEKLTVLEHAREKQLVLLKPALEQAKKAFQDVTLPFMVQARGSKTFMVPLIEEWADKAGHKDSMLLHWSEEEDGDEMKMFEQNITTARELEGMCSDLVHFTQAIMNSCPKAMAQYDAIRNDLANKHEPN